MKDIQNKKLKISFCTASMNRSFHIRETLLQNIADNEDFPDIEFILLDYHSTDGLEDYIKTNCIRHIQSGILFYYRTVEPSFFHHSHARNLAFRLASGDIICNLDADNFTGTNFAAYICDIFENHTNCFLSGSGSSDILGRICVRKEDFYAVTGFDENMEGYGFEDNDLVSRLLSKGLKRIAIDNIKFLNAIRHDDGERIKNIRTRQLLEDLIVLPINYFSSQLCFLFQNGALESGTVIENKAKNASDPFIELKDIPFDHEFCLTGKTWEKGRWYKQNDHLILKTGNQSLYLKRLSDDHFIDNDELDYYSVGHNKSLVEEGLFFHCQLRNRAILETNQSNSSAVNSGNSFGKGTVYRNFDYETKIKVG